MNSDCLAFRRDLAEALDVDTLDTSARRALGWHEHLLSCDACRDMLSKEEALDELLASLPVPRLPQDLARRVLARLAAERLEDLLALADEPVVPSGLSQRVLAGVRDRELDALDVVLGRLPEPVVPSDLAARTLRALAPQRAEPAAAGKLLAFPRALLASAAAAAVLVAGLLWFVFGRERDASSLAPTENDAPFVVDADEVVDPELLDALDVLENWEAVTSDDLDLLLAELDAIDLALLEHGDEPATEEGG